MSSETVSPSARSWRQLSWSEVAEEVPLPLREVLAAQAASMRDPVLYRAVYHYGDSIIESGKLRFPPGVAGQLPEDLAYQPIPLGLLVDKSAELLVEDRQGNVETLRVLQPGEFFGVFEFLDLLSGGVHPKPNWSACAGARSMVVLAPLGNTNLLPRQMRISLPPRKKPSSQVAFDLIKMLTVKKDYGWSATALILPQKWVALNSQGPLEAHLYKVGWRQAQHFRHRHLDGQRIDQFVSEFTTKKHAMTHAAVWKYLVAVSRGDAPIFTRPRGDTAGPFERALLDITELVRNVGHDCKPALLHQEHLTQENRIGYQSLRTFCRPTNGRKIRLFEDLVEPLDVMRQHWDQDIDYSIDASETGFLALGNNHSNAVRSPPRVELKIREEIWEDRQDAAYVDHPFLSAFCRLVLR